MKDRTGADYRMACHGTASIDLVAESGNHVQVKTVGTLGSFAGIQRGRDTAIEVMVITNFGGAPRFFLVPMDEFKKIGGTYDYPNRNHFSWEINGFRIKKGALTAFEITPAVDFGAAMALETARVDD